MLLYRGDYSAVSKLADTYTSQKEYGLTLKNEHLKWPIIAKSIYIDTLRGSAGRWGIKVILLLIMVILEVVKWKSSYIVNISSIVIINALCLLFANEYFYYAEQLVDNNKKGLILPISPFELTISGIVMPSAFICLIYILYSFLNSFSILLVVALTIINLYVDETLYVNQRGTKSKENLSK